MDWWPSLAVSVIARKWSIEDDLRKRCFDHGTWGFARKWGISKLTKPGILGAMCPPPFLSKDSKWRTGSVQFTESNHLVKPNLHSWDVGCSWMFGFLMSSSQFLETYRFWYVSSSPQLKTMNPPSATPYCLQSGSFWARTPQGDLVRLGLRAFPFWLTFSSGINPTNNGESLSTTNNYE